MWSKLNIKITKKIALILTLVVVSSFLLMVIRESRELSLYEAYAEEMCSHISIGDSYENVQDIINNNLKNSESESFYKITILMNKPFYWKYIY